MEEGLLTSDIAPNKDMKLLGFLLEEKGFLCNTTSQGIRPLPCDEQNKIINSRVKF